MRPPRSASFPSHLIQRPCRIVFFIASISHDPYFDIHQAGLSDERQEKRREAIVLSLIVCGPISLWRTPTCEISFDPKVAYSSWRRFVFGVQGV